MPKKPFLAFTILLGLFFIGALPAQAARLYFDPGEKSVSQDSTFDADLWLDTEGANTSGADVVLDFDASKVTVESVGFDSLYSSGVVRNKDNTSGRLEFSVYFDDLFSVYEGSGRLATIRFKAGSQNSDVNFVCQAGGTADTNVLEFNGGDILDCGALGNLKITISASASPSPSPSSGDDGGGGGVQPPGDTSSPESPDRPTNLTATSGPGRGQVTLRWNKSSGATHYAIAFGERWLDFDYGAANVGDTDQFLVNGLKTGVPYYFVVAAVKNGASSGWSDGASAYAGYGAVSSSRQTVYTPPTQQKGWTPPEPIEFEAEDLKLDEDEATQGAVFEPSPSPSPSATPKPYYEPPEPKKPWQKTDFWKKLGLILLVLFLLWLLLGFLRRRKRQKTVKKKMEKNVTDLSGKQTTEAKPASTPPPPF